MHFFSEQIISQTKKFQAGDLVYGLDIPRRKYPRLYKLFIKAYPFVRGHVVWIDQYTVLKTDQQVASMYPQNLARGFFDFLRSKITKPKKEFHIFHTTPHDYNLFMKALLDHPKYHTILSSEPTNNLDRRRRAKGGLYWATKNNKTVHFILDDIDFERVVHKINERDAQGNKHQGITSAELRWLFRHKDESGVKENVQFLLAGEAVPAPWTEAFDNKTTNPASHFWKQYQPKSLNQSAKNAEADKQSVTSLGLTSKAMY